MKYADYLEEGRAPSKRKNTSRWCKGKVGREHVYAWHPMTEAKRMTYMDGWDVEVCDNCGRNRNWRHPRLMPEKEAAA